jgi:PKD repeat protein
VDSNGESDDEEEEGTETAEGTLLLQITDNPAILNILYANVTISVIQVHKSDDDEEEEEDDNEYENVDEEDDGFIADGDGPYFGEINEDIDFKGNASGGSKPYNFSWDFGDGHSSFGQNVTHNYSTNGTYDVNLTVVDNESRVDWYLTSAIIGEVENDDNDSDAGWYTIVEESQTFDLMVLQDVKEELGLKNLSVGKYTQIRLTVEKAEITIDNDGEIEAHNLKIPSSKVKLIKPFWIYKDNTTVLTLDFDVYKSVHKTGNDKYIMNPTIKVIQE